MIKFWNIDGPTNYLLLHQAIYDKRNQHGSIQIKCLIHGECAIQFNSIQFNSIYALEVRLKRNCNLVHMIYPGCGCCNHLEFGFESLIKIQALNTTTHRSL